MAAELKDPCFISKSPSFGEEIARWHRFSDGAIGSTGTLLILFLATTPPYLRERLHDTIMAELQTDKSPVEG